MAASRDQTIVVTGATGLQGGAVARHLLAAGWRVRTLTRNPGSQKAQALAALGAEVVQGNLSDQETLIPLFEGAYGVFSVQNPAVSGIDEEVKQGKNVADVARQVGVQHLVYSSAGPAVRDTGIGSWESKWQIEDYIKSLKLPLTVLRPMAFMELMNDKKFFPAVSTWQLMPALMGGATKIPWICTEDLGAVVARIFAGPQQFIGRSLPLASDVQSIDGCRTLYREVMGKAPARFPMPVWLFERFGFSGRDLTTMWRWLGKTPFDTETSTTYSIHPGALSVKAWLAKQKRTESIK